MKSNHGSEGSTKSCKVLLMRTLASPDLAVVSCQPPFIPPLHRKSVMNHNPVKKLRWLVVLGSSSSQLEAKLAALEQQVTFRAFADLRSSQCCVTNVGNKFWLHSFSLLVSRSLREHEDFMLTERRDLNVASAARCALMMQHFHDKLVLISEPVPVWSFSTWAFNVADLNFALQID